VQLSRKVAILVTTTTPTLSDLLKLPVLRAAYSDRTAWLMARCSQLAYVEFETGQEPQLRSALKELGLEFVRGFSENATCAFLARNERFAVLAFRGTTEDFRNILSDINIRFYRDKSGARTSTGFSEAYKLVQREIAGAIDALEPSLPLYITGHSLGGALAAIASTRILPSDRIAACYTYGCPRVGDGEFTFQLWKVPVYRQVHYSDIVPHAPLAFGYRQAGDFRYIKRNGKMIQDPSTIAFLCSFLFSAVTNFKSIFLNHRIAGYVDALQAWAILRLKLDGQAQSAQATSDAIPPPVNSVKSRPPGTQPASPSKP
jgi:triacylglycerol lipase